MTRNRSIEMLDIKTTLDDFIRILNSDEITSAAKTTARGFTQTRKITLLDVLMFYTFRFAETTNKDISSLFSKLEKPKVSKQGMFKALNKLNPDVFPIIINHLAEKFYSHGDYKTLDGYIVLACDGTKMDLPPSDEMKEAFGGYLNQNITEYSRIRKPQANCSILIDVVNHVILDAMVRPCMTSEIPMLFQHLENCERMLQGKRIILLCDRYYGSAELYLYCMIHGYKYIVRNKSYAYRDYTSRIDTDGEITVPFNKAWYQRMKRDDCREYAQNLAALPLRVVKNRYEYILSGRKKKQEPTVIESVYLSNLDSELFPTERIVSLYHTQRWDNETAYLDIKSHLEAERFNSGKHNIVVNEIYGKILCYVLCGRLYENASAHKQRPGRKNLYAYIPNMKYICDAVRMEHKLIQYIRGLVTRDMEAYLGALIEDLSRHLVPVRPGRHYRRWGRWMSSIPTSKYRIDGRRNPLIKKCYKGKGYMTSQ